MGTLRIQQQSLDLNLMNPFASKLRATIGLSSATFRCFCASSSAPFQTATEEVKGKLINRKSASKSNGRLSSKVSDAQLKEDWLDSLSCPFPEKLLRSDSEGIDVSPSNSSSSWVIGVDPDVSGALALLKPEDDSGCSAQVFDSPIVKLLVGGRARRRLDAKSIVQLLKSFDCPVGTTAYLEQSIPFPGDGKQGWWSGGFAYGLWIGVLVASGFKVIPVPSVVWKNEFKLSGNGSSKDSSRELASTLFPSMSSSLRRKKDHGSPTRRSFREMYDFAEPRRVLA